MGTAHNGLVCVHGCVPAGSLGVWRLLQRRDRGFMSRVWGWDPLRPLCWGVFSLPLPSWRLEGCSVSEVLLQGFQHPLFPLKNGKKNNFRSLLGV